MLSYCQSLTEAKPTRFMPPDLLSETFAGICHAQPQQTALDIAGEALCFSTLYAQSQTLAAALAQYKAQAVGLFFHAETAYYLALLACMQAGAIAVPLDAAQALPAASASDLGLALCLSRRADLPVLSPWADGPVWAFEELMHKPPLSTRQAETALPEVLHRVSTSGSSGQHTEVSIGRQALALHVQEMGAAYGCYRPGTAHANLSRHSSAAGINGFWRVLLNGACFVSADLRREGLFQVWRHLQNRPELHSLQGQPSLLSQLAQSCGHLPAAVRPQQLMLGGESLAPQQLAQMAVLLPPDGLVSYNYSSSETLHIALHTAPLKTLLQCRHIPCGKPLPSREVLLVDPEGQPVPTGEPGQIVVRSAHLALQIKGPHAERRLQLDPEQPGLWRYLTGDLGRWNAQGLLEHLGRSDRRVKVRGQWVDLNAVERALLTLPEVSQARVIVLQRDTESILIACLVRPGPRSSQTGLYQHLQAQLPAAALPAQCLDIDQLPLLPGGKVDLQALQQRAEQQLSLAPDEEGLSRPLVQALQKNWERVLKSPLGANAGSFVASGGNSLKAAVLVSHLNEHYQLNLPPWWALQHQSLQEQAEDLQAQLTASTACYSAPNSPSAAAVRKALGW